MIKGSINVSLIDKEQLIPGKKGKYLPFVMYENDEPDQYGNHYVIKFDLPQEKRQAGEKAKIIGNAKIAGAGKPKPQAEPAQAAPAGDESDDVPF